MTAESIRAALPSGLTVGGQVICLDNVDSTNTYLKNLALEGAPHGAVVVAHAQTGGRGRRERRFESPAGAGLYLSVLLRFDCPPAELVDLTAWTAVAVCAAVENCCGVRTDIKWTNDLLLNGRKVCGILTELVPDGNGGFACVAGIGINLRQSRADFAAAGLEEIATSLTAEGVEQGVTRSGLAAAVIAELDRMTAAFPEKRAAWLADYRSRCVTVGRRVLVLRGEECAPALALAVEDDFSLRVRYDDGREENVSSGEVSIRGMMAQD